MPQLNVRTVLWRTGPCLLFVLIFVLGRLLSGAPQDPTEYFGWTAELGTVLIFLSWVIAILCWGGWITRLTGLSGSFGPEAVLMGVAWAVVVAAAFGSLGYAGEAASRFWIPALTLGPFLWVLQTPAPPLFDAAASSPAPVSRQQRKQQAKRAPNPLTGKRLALGLKAAIGLVLIATFAASLRLSFFQDPIWYHLVSARFWFDSGKIQFNPRNLVLYQGGLWDYLFLWGHELTGGLGGKGLIAGHLFGQMIHVALGFGGTAVMSYAIAGLLELSGTWALVACLAALGTRELIEVAVMAKNDWGSIFLGLGALWVLFSAKRNIQRTIFAGVLFGLAVAAKYTAAFILLPFIGAFLLERREPGGWRSMLSDLALLAVGGLLGLFPLLARNYIGTGNPFFPAMNSLFHSPFIGPTWERTLGVDFEGGLQMLGRPEILFIRLGRFLASGPIIWTVLAVPFLWKKRLLTIRERTWSIALLCGFLLFFVGSGPILENRLLGVAFPLAILLGVAGLGGLFARRRDLEDIEPQTQAVLAVLVLAFGGFPWFSISDLVSAGPPSRQLETVDGAKSVLWARKNLSREDRIILPGEARTYYLSDFGATRIAEDSELDRDLSNSSGLIEKIQAIRRHGYTVMYIDKSRIWDDFFDKGLRDLLVHASIRNEARVARFHATESPTDESMIVDLAKLQDAVSAEGK